jgi:hypothetical protein
VRTTRLSLVLLSALLCAPLYAQTEGIAEFKGETHSSRGQTIPSTGKVFLSRSAVRVEWQTQVAGSDRKAGAPDRFRMTMIQKQSEPDRSYMLNEERKTYSVMEFDTKREKKERSAEKWTAEKLGRDTVAGFSCEKLKMTSASGSVTEACVAQELMPSTAWLRAWNRRSEQSGPFQAMKDAGVEGFPVRWIFREKGSDQISSQIELVRFERKSVPASLFEIPSDYRKVDTMMETMATTPEQEKAMRDARKQMDEALEKMSPEERKQYEEMMKRYAPTPHS